MFLRFHSIVFLEIAVMASLHSSLNDMVYNISQCHRYENHGILLFSLHLFIQFLKDQL